MPGCIDANACNFNEFALMDDGSCFYPPAGYDCEENCLEDEDDDGICDEFDDCVGVLDECGVCNGPGAVYECGCDDIAEGYCDCEFNVFDAVGECGGFCVADFEGDGICDCYEESFGDPILIPDDPETCIELELTVEGFSEGILPSGLYANMEHSFVADLVISLTCPNGQQLTVHEQGGGGTWLGIPFDSDGDPLTPGVGFPYWWTQDPEYDTWEAMAGGTETLPPGSYTSVQDWGNLEGCPTNGVWSLEVCDFWGSDNGFLFDWGIEMGGQDLFYFGAITDCTVGCTDELACNFSALATDDDGTCVYPGDPCDDGDDTTFNDVYTADCDCVGEVDGLDEAVGLTWTLYPSPVRDVLNLRIEGGAWSGTLDGDVEVMVLGATGQVLRSERLAGRTQIDVSDLASGVYFLTLRSPEMTAPTRRFVVAGGE